MGRGACARQSAAVSCCPLKRAIQLTCLKEPELFSPSSHRPSSVGRPLLCGCGCVVSVCMHVPVRPCVFAGKGVKETSSGRVWGRESPPPRSPKAACDAHETHAHAPVQSAERGFPPATITLDDMRRRAGKATYPAPSSGLGSPRRCMCFCTTKTPSHL